MQESVHHSGFTKPRDITLLKSSVNRYLTLWLQYEEQRKIAMQEEESLYKFKTNVYDLDEPEEERENREIAELFTTFDAEYKDIDSECQNDSDSMKNEKHRNDDKKQKAFDLLKIPDSDVNHICHVHRFIVSSLPSAAQVVATLNQTFPGKEENVNEVKVFVESFNVAANLVCHGRLTGMFIVEYN